MGPDEVAKKAIEAMEKELPEGTQYLCFIFAGKDVVTGNLMLNPTVHAGQLIWVAQMLMERGLFMVRKGLARELTPMVSGPNMPLPGRQH